MGAGPGIGTDLHLRAPADDASSMSTRGDNSVARGHKVSRYLVATDQLTVDSRRQVRVVFSTRSGINAMLPERLWSDLLSGAFAAIPEHTLKELIDAQFVVDAEEDELQSVIDENLASAAETRQLEQVIQPSAACQLGCGYCGQEHQAHHMDARVQAKLVGRIERRLDHARRRGLPYEHLLVGWFGAEPLLGIGAMRRLSPDLAEAARAREATYSARIVTNGMRLTLPVAHELQDVHAVEHVEVTLDGTAETHDQRRFTKAGRPTFARILGNVLDVARDPELRFKLVVRCNVDQHNAEAVPELIEMLADAGAAKRIGLYFSPVYAWGNDAGETALQPADYAAREVTWFAQMIRRGYHVDLLPERKRIVCLAVQPEARVTDAYGSEFNCTEAPYVPAYGEPNRYSTGDVFGNTGAAPFFRDFTESIAASSETWCRTCQLLPVCGGACPKAWADGNPPCPSHKRNLADRVLLNFARSRIQGELSLTPSAAPTPRSPAG